MPTYHRQAFILPRKEKILLLKNMLFEGENLTEQLGYPSMTVSMSNVRNMQREQLACQTYVICSVKKVVKAGHNSYTHWHTWSRYYTNIEKLDVSICEFTVRKSDWVSCLFNPIECLHLSTPPIDKYSSMTPPHRSLNTGWNWVQTAK